jgi:hypothetical protein
MHKAKIDGKLDRLKKKRLVRECAKLDPQIQKDMAEEGFPEDLYEWPRD